MKDRITKKEYLAFVKAHEKNTYLQFDLTDCEVRFLLHTLGYNTTACWVASAEWRNFFDSGKINSPADSKKTLENLCELSIMKEEIIDNHYVYFATELGKKVARIKYVQLVRERRKTKYR